MLVTTRRFNRGLGTLGVLFLLAVCGSATATATVIQYQATDLVDVTVGEDLWQYEYFVTAPAFSADQGFSVYFDPLLYSSLLDGPGPAAWDILVFQPDLLLPSDGAYDALALVDGATLEQPFTVSFVWLGSPGSAPSAQPFDVYELDSAGSLLVLESGLTTPLEAPNPIPEPSAWLLLASGLTLVLRHRRRKT